MKKKSECPKIKWSYITLVKAEIKWFRIEIYGSQLIVDHAFMRNCSEVYLLWEEWKGRMIEWKDERAIEGSEPNRNIVWRPILEGLG